MSTEVLLLSDIETLGKAGDVVKVADGYARNYLLPKDLAAPVSTHALRRLEKLRKEREELSRIQMAEAKEKSKKLADASASFLDFSLASAIWMRDSSSRSLRSFSRRRRACVETGAARSLGSR